MNPESIDKLFSVEQQRRYVSILKGRVGVTRCRAEYFVRLWAYLFFKQQMEWGKSIQLPVTELHVPEGFVSCTHQEAATLFYAHKDRGSDRAAGMMIDRLVALGLIEKQFDGNTISIRIRSLLPYIKDSLESAQSAKLMTDAFNPRIDAIPVASFFAQNYNWMNTKATAVPQRIARILRHWAEQYPLGMRVLRRCDTLHPVGFYALYPTAPESEQNFFLPPSRSLHLSAATDIDPIKMATPGDLNCTSLFIRGWQIKSPYKEEFNPLCTFLEDAKKILIQMQADFPNLCDMYTLSIHPTTEALATAVGFQKTSQDPQLSVSWLYMPIEQYLALDIEQALVRLRLD
ncbi:MAG: hypothetical protein VKL59_01700 [Nostocaceae cyanobacterium]|nr:hypothetical protein [Nostocaceae cyanobacterium]